MGQIYTVENQQPQTYVEEGVPINGFLVQVRLHEFNEILQLNVPRLEADLIAARVQEMLEQRRRLAELGD